MCYWFVVVVVVIVVAVGGVGVGGVGVGCGVRFMLACCQRSFVMLLFVIINIVYCIQDKYVLYIYILTEWYHCAFHYTP